jgi:hypothetical protein
MPELPLTGGCGCGAVRFEVTAPLEGANYCHCTRCQRRTGTAASANAKPAPGSFRITQGEEHLRAWRPDNGFEKVFCGECGSALFSRDPQDHERVGIRLGGFDSDPGVRPSVRQFVAYAAPWEPIPDDGLPRHPESSRQH